MRNRYKFGFIFFCILEDFLAIIVGTVLFFKITQQSAFYWGDFTLFDGVCVAVITWLIPAMYFKLYQLENTFNLYAFYRSTWRTLLAHFILWQVCLAVFRFNSLQRNVENATIFHIGFMVFYFFASRVAFTWMLMNLKKWIKNSQTVAIWGFNKTSIDLAQELETNSYLIDFVGIINENSEQEYKSKKEFGEALSEVIVSASGAKINKLFVVAKPAFIQDLNRFFELADRYCIRLKFVPDFSGISKGSFIATHFNNFHVIKPRNEPLQEAYNRLLKRIFDIVFSAIVITFLLSWIYPLLALIIKNQSKGPVLFKQLRTGKKNESFWCYKFRSMRLNTESDSLQAQKEDPRITPIGHFMRRTSIDELPQFFNVLLGNMSVVGPRPHMIKQTDDYNELIQNFMVRHFVKPGITGLAQVSGQRGETKTVLDMKRRVKTDIIYLQKWTLIGDIKICILTIFMILKGDKNAF